MSGVQAGNKKQVAGPTRCIYRFLVVNVFTFITICTLVNDVLGQRAQEYRFSKHAAKIHALFQEFERLDLESVRNLLEMTAKQTKKLDSIRLAFDKNRSLLHDLSKSGFSDEDLTILYERALEDVDLTRGSINDLLLPHQAKLLRQMKIQEKAKLNESLRGLTSAAVFDVTNPEAEQKKRQSEIIKKIEQLIVEEKRRFESEIKQIRDEASRKSLEELSSSQKKKYEQFFGIKLRPFINGGKDDQ